MPPKAHLEPHLTLEELKNHYRHAQDATEIRRWHLLYLVAQNWSIKQAAQVIDLNYDYAKEIIRRYNREGPQATINRSRRRGTSPRSLLSPDQQDELRSLLQQPAPDGGEWSGPKVAQWIAKKTGRKWVWPQRGWDYLQRFRPDHLSESSSSRSRSVHQS